MPYAPTLTDEGIRRIDRQSHFPNEGRPEILSSFIFICGYLWGVCHTPLPCRMKEFRKIDRQFSFPNEWIPEDQSAIPFS